jgi:glycosyltransferase involved in cell wall biosynthesis
MKLSVIIPTKDRPAVFNSTIVKVVEALQEIDAEVIVVNDSKTSDVFIPESSADIQIHNNPKSGVASARNFGASFSSGDILLFLDDDILMTRSAVEGIFLLHKRYPDAAITLPRKYSEELMKRAKELSFGRFLIKTGFSSVKDEIGLEWKDDEVFEINVAASYCLFMSKSTFQITNGYDEIFPFAGFEDYDFSMRLDKAKIKKFQCSKYFVDDNEKDRIDLKNWLRIKFQASQTRVLAVLKGYSELSIVYSEMKFFSYTILSPFKFMIIGICYSMLNLKLFDPIYFRLVHILIGITIFEGYNKGMRMYGK